MCLPTTESETDDFIHAFESCTLPKQRWTHAAHIFTGACYVKQYGESAAIDRMRQNVSRYNESVGGRNTGTSGYHETITVFWIKLLSAFYSAHSDAAPLGRQAFAIHAVERFATDRKILTRFYDFDVVNSIEARRSWVPPTRAAIKDFVISDSSHQ